MDTYPKGSAGLKKSLPDRMITLLIALLLFPNVSQIVTNHGMDSESNCKIYQLEPGDIAFRTVSNIIDHCLIYVEYLPNNDTYKLIEANMTTGVHYRYLTKKTLEGEEYNLFARVKTANTTQKQNAIQFAIRQLKKPFDKYYTEHNKNYNPNDPNDPYSDWWYCSELIWAAYYNCNHHPDEEIYGEGIDIDRNEWKKDWLIYSTVKPTDILRDDDTRVFFLKMPKNYDNKQSILENSIYKLIPILNETFHKRQIIQGKLNT